MQRGGEIGKIDEACNIINRNLREIGPSSKNIREVSYEAGDILIGNEEREDRNIWRNYIRE